MIVLFKWIKNVFHRYHKEKDNMSICSHLAQYKEKMHTFLYTYPNIIRPSLAIPAEIKPIINELKENGIVKYNSSYLEEVSEHVIDNYFNKIMCDGVEEAEASLKNNHPHLFIEESYPPGRKNEYTLGGTEILHYISFKDEIVSQLFLDEELGKVIYNYYQRQPFYRNMPVIQQLSINENTSLLLNGQWHVDHFRQISLMLLLSDVTEKDTHMQYIMGSHSRKNNPGLSSDGLVNEIIKNDSSKIYKLIGKKGTLYVFDASGIHRAFYRRGSTRRILHMNITTGRHIINTKKEDYQTWDLLKDKPSYIKKMFNKI